MRFCDTNSSGSNIGVAAIMGILDITAELNKGVLTVIVPKIPVKEQTKRRIEVK